MFAENRPQLVSDHGSQPTSGAFFKACSELGIRQIFASYNKPKGNAETERVIRTIKEDLVWIREFDSVAAFEAALKMLQKAYNEDFPHSSLGYMTPYEYERWFKASAAKNRLNGFSMDSQKILCTFFDRLSVMQPLTNGVHYRPVLPVGPGRQLHFFSFFS